MVGNMVKEKRKPMVAQARPLHREDVEKRRKEERGGGKGKAEIILRAGFVIFLECARPHA